MPAFLFFRDRLSPDQGNLTKNGGWVEVLNVVPYGNRWLADSFFVKRATLVAAPIKLVVSKAWQEDNSGGPSYVDITTDINDADADDAQPFPSGAGINDALYLGFTSHPEKLLITIGTDQTGQGGYTVTWEYWDGSAWSALSGVTDATNGFQSGGEAKQLTYTMPTDWATTSVNGSASLYYIRARRDGGTVTRDPVLSQVIENITDFRGMHINAQNGTNAWKIYGGTESKLFSIEPATWTVTLHNAGYSQLDSDYGWQFTGYGDHEIAVGGHTIDPQIRLSDAGNYAALITNAEPVPTGGAATGNWPPKAKFVAVWGDSVAIANLTDVGPANAFGNTCPWLWWVSKVQDAQTFGIIDSHPGDGTTFDYVSNDHGDITALAGGPRFGAIFQARATHRVEYYAGDAIVGVDRVGDGIGTIFPNSVVVAEDEIYFMSLEGPAVLSRSGPPRIIGMDEIQRTLFDESWIVDTYTLNTDQSAAYYCYGVYHPVQDVVSFYYRTTADQMDMVLHYHRPTKRWSFGVRNQMVTAGATTIQAARVMPRLEATRWSSAQGLIFIDNSGNVWEADAATGDRWRHQITFRTPRMIFAREDDVPLRARPMALLPHYSLIAGAVNVPEITVTCAQYERAGTNTTAASEAVSSEGEEGYYEFSSTVRAMWHDFEIKIGNAATMANVENLASVLEGFEVSFEAQGKTQ